MAPEPRWRTLPMFVNLHTLWLIYTKKKEFCFKCDPSPESVVNKYLFGRKYFSDLSSPLTRLHDIYLQEIRHMKSSKIRYYMESYHIGINYNLQACNEKIKNPCYRKALVRLRSGTNCLFLEKGRYDNIPQQDRICPLC